jgi:hypothetical protein
MVVVLKDKITDKYFVPNRDARDMDDMNKLVVDAKGRARSNYRMDVYGRHWNYERARNVLMAQLREIDLWSWRQELRLVGSRASSRIVRFN